jgi:hypothetical protein
MARRCVDVRPIAMFIIATAAFGSSTPARAQADLNLQNRLQVFSPAITVLQPSTAPAKNEIQLKSGKCVSKNDPAVQRALTYHNKVHAPVSVEYYVDHPEKLMEDLTEQTALDRRSGKLQKFALPPSPINFACTIAQPTNLTISAPFNPTYESNVLKSNTNIQRDISQGFGGSMVLTAPGLKDRPFDLVAFSVASASARYSAFPSKSFDALSEQGLYQIFLGASRYDDKGKPVGVYPGAPDIPSSSNLITVDTLSLGYQNQTAFTPGYRIETADLFTPQATLGRQNISLLGSDVNNTCSTTSGTLGFCNYVDLSLTAGHTFSDVITLQNTNVAASATLGWRIDKSDWKVTVPIVVTAKDFDNVVGGRRDALVQGGTVLSYVLPTKPGEPSLMFSLAGTYYRNYSTVAAAAWHGFIVQPTLTIAFNPPIAFK